MVWLLTKNIKTERPLKKLDHKMIGPYKITELVKLLYQLDLPTSIRIHDIFHLNLLQPAAIYPLPKQHNSLPLPIVVNDKEE